MLVPPPTLKTLEGALAPLVTAPEAWAKSFQEIPESTAEERMVYVMWKMRDDLLEFVQMVQSGNTEPAWLLNVATCIQYGMYMTAEYKVDLFNETDGLQPLYTIRSSELHCPEGRAIHTSDAEHAMWCWHLLVRFHAAHTEFEKAYQKAKEAAEA